MDTRFRRRSKARDPALVKRLLLEGRKAFKLKKATITASYALMVAPPYPAEPVLEVHTIGVLGRLDGQSFHSCSAPPGRRPRPSTSSSRARPG
jgi:hypothetical protein